MWTIWPGNPPSPPRGYEAVVRLSRVECRTGIDVVLIVQHVHRYIGYVHGLNVGDVQVIFTDGDLDIGFLRTLDGRRNEGRTHTCRAYTVVPTLGHDHFLNVLIDGNLHVDTY